jgi:hypothetical protein
LSANGTPRDVVLAEIAADLHLNEFEIDLAGIVQTVSPADRHINRLVLVQHLHFVADGNVPGIDHPVLCAVMVQLKRQPPPCFTAMRLT